MCTQLADRPGELAAPKGVVADDEAVQPDDPGGDARLIIAGLTVAVVAVAVRVWCWRTGMRFWHALVCVLFGLYFAVVLACTGTRPGGHGGLGPRREGPTMSTQPAGRPQRGRTRIRRERVMPS